MAAFLSSAAYVVYRSSHRCVGKGCGTCCQIASILFDTYREKPGPPAGLNLFVALLFSLLVLIPNLPHFSSPTPIGLKVKMTC